MICRGLRCLFSTPVWLSFNRSTAIRRCLCVSPGAETGESGRKMNMTIPQIEHSAPLHCRQLSWDQKYTQDNLHHEKLVLPRRKSTLDIPDPIAQQPAQRNPNAIGRIPQSHAHRLLASRIPHTRDEHESGVSAGLGSSTEGSKHGEGFEAVACSLDHEEDAPTWSRVLAGQLMVILVATPTT